jgi:Mn-dependent DtxR family transcriptional regulator
MRAHRTDTESQTPATAHLTDAVGFQERAEQTIMMLLLSGEHQGPWTRSEIALELSATPLDVSDALAALHGSGLVHLQGELVIASRAARRMDELEV